MTTATLFGIALAPLFAAIAEVESENGKTSDNVYQLSDAYIKDANRIHGRLYGKSPFRISDALDADMSRGIMLVYLRYYGYVYYTSEGKDPTAEVLVRIHNGGPDGWRKESTLKYWHKVKAVMERSNPCPNH